jgi:hydroxymethylbilane synthase
MTDHGDTGEALGPQSSVLRVATRGSALALRQTEIVVDALRARWPGLRVDVVTVRTTGDRDQAAPLATLGDGVFVRGVEAELLAGRADAAVHSAKDIPSAEPPGLVLAAFPPRADPRDVLVSRSGAGFAELPPGARLGTASPRRHAIARVLRPDLEVALIRGNVDTRLRKLEEGEYDAIVLAAAGLDRMGLAGRVTEYLDPLVWVPAAGQGVLAVQCRTDDPARPLLTVLDDPATRAAITAERAVLRRLGSGCRTPVGAHARPMDGRLALHGLLVAPEGSRRVTAERLGDMAEAEAMGAEVADELMAKGRDFFE